MKTKLLISLIALVLAASATLASAAEEKSKIENQKSKAPKPYPLKVCIVTDNDLDSMGDESSIIHEGQVIKFCCAPCEKKFRQNPARYLAKLAPKPPAKK